MRTSCTGHCSCSRAGRCIIAGALIPIIVCIIVSMLQQKLWARRRTWVRA
jgi:hypothetical protein